jgi:AAHS family 4-hydroxybenzoate transporter-like MFS transporter
MPSRATGVSWANGVGRLDSLLGSMLGGVLLSPGRQLSTAFAIVAVPAFVAGASMLAMGRLMAARREERNQDAACLIGGHHI